jgi:hypothetical protein
MMALPRACLVSDPTETYRAPTMNGSAKRNSYLWLVERAGGTVHVVPDGEQASRR